MNLAVRDIRHNWARFVLTSIGIGLLLMIVMGMGGIYQGLVDDAILLINRIDADLWIVQNDTRGPFAEISKVPMILEDRLKSVPGVQSSRSFVSHTVQREHNGKPLRIVVQGLSWPDDKGEWLPLISGRPLGAAHYEMIADKLLGLNPGEKIKLGKDYYTVVGITSDMVSQSGDGLGFFTVRDALNIQFETAGESVRLERQARKSRVLRQDLGNIQPSLVERAESLSSELPGLARPMVSAVLVKLKPDADINSVISIISGWKDVTVYTATQQKEFLLKGTVDRARRQIGLFSALLVIISAIIMALIIYTLTLDKTYDIAMLKLIGARNSVILGLILQQALLLGSIGYVLAYYLGAMLFPLFPRRVIITTEGMLYLAGIVLLISISSSALGVWKAMKIQPNEALS
jgi:putative ABC transport system permease protein